MRNIFTYVCDLFVDINVDLKNWFARFQLSVVFGSFKPSVGSLACGVNAASSKLLSFK